MKNIENCCQLHETVEVHYRVDCYSAQLWTGDGSRMVAVALGKTVLAALVSLDEVLEGWDLTRVRSSETIACKRL